MTVELSKVERPTRHSLGHFGDDVYRSLDKDSEGGWLVIQTGLGLTRLTSPC